MLTVQAAQRVASLVRLLHAVDAFPRGGLYQGYYAVAAALRYERYWMRIVDNPSALPPLDVAFAWWVHRQDPAFYSACMAQAGAKQPHPTPRQAYSFGSRHDCELVWERVAAGHPFFPPPAPGSPHDVETELLGKPPAFVPRLAASMARFSTLLRSWLRPHFLDVAFMEQARGRYVRFLQLLAANPSMPLVPAADIALLWHTHMGLSDSYEALCTTMYGRDEATGQVRFQGPDYLDLDPASYEASYEETTRLYEKTYGEPYAGPNTAPVRRSTPYPLAEPGSPITFALRVYDVNPDREAQQDAINVAAAAMGLEFPKPGAETPRAGAHALYLSWLAAQRAERVYDTLTCGRCCWTWTSGTQKKTLGHAAGVMASMAYFVDVPSMDSHPYLAAITRRRGLWQPGGLPLPDVEPPPPPRLGAGPVWGAFSPLDPEIAIYGGNSRFLVGLAPLLASAAGGQAARERADYDRGYASPLWLLLGEKAAVKAAAAAFEAALADAARRGVGRMQQAMLVDRVSNNGLYYGSTDYYVGAQLQIVYAYSSHVAAHTVRVNLNAPSGRWVPSAGSAKRGGG
ncbi:hypothetical protein HYH03_001322 [Edaphochlamys debaryana]|uniref:Uncharacterized protein n=1 Tax=Edaphochlamys debaryana TaxID=47281 RepID=A0A836C5Y3_9CHLO|nr:hypothetical protein HYH03_001322 [Edaphochlamys debaryana]|eukprot:KAG2500548.1 hypothetical protein HYH03_001322 [Edaphochlamys debaryana]